MLNHDLEQKQGDGLCVSNYTLQGENIHPYSVPTMPVYRNVSLEMLH